MGVKIYWTSSIDGFITIFRIITNIIYLTFFIGLPVYIIEKYGIMKELNLGPNGNLAIFLGILIGGYLISYFVYRKTATIFFATLSTYLYVRSELKTKLTWSESANVSFLFAPNSTKKWYPLYTVLRLPQEQRTEYILSFANNVIKDLNNK